MNCPKCEVTAERISPACFWCPQCGWMGGQGGGRVPAQAKSHAAMREALAKIKNLARNGWTDTDNIRWLFERIEERAALALDAEAR